MDIAELLAFSVKNNASDLHLSAGLPPMIRVDGDIRRINLPSLEHKEVHALIYDIMNDKQRKDYEEFLETDELGMRTFDQALYKLYTDGEISYDEAIRNSDSPNELRLMIKLSEKDSVKKLGDAADGLSLVDADKH
mgnify:CR=1 FL=1